MGSWIVLGIAIVASGLAPARASAQDARAASRALIDARACYAGEHARCVIAGDAYHEGRGVPESHPLAAQLYRYGCDHGDLAACRAFGLLWQEGHGVPESAREAQRYFAIACDGGLALACYDLGTLHWIGRGAAPSWSAGRELYQRACELRHAEACRELAFVHGRGLGLPRDLARTAELLRRACELGSESACAEAADPASAVAAAEAGPEGSGARTRSEPGLPEAQLARLLERFAREARPAERLLLARRLAFGGVRLRCAQIAELMRTAPDDASRLPLALALWPRAVDPENVEALAAALEHEGSRTLLRQQIGEP